jgi:hypothetical protein
MSTKGIAVGAAVLLTFACTGVAAAATAQTPVGTITATQRPNYPCNDFGADVIVTVQNGFASKAYHAVASRYQVAADFTTNAAGAGSGTVGSVLPPSGWVGTAIVTVTANGQTGQVPVAITCDDPRGKD